MATQWLASGVPVKVVSERLGHANLAITLAIYGHLLPHMQAAAAERMDARFFEGDGPQMGRRNISECPNTFHDEPRTKSGPQGSNP